MRIREGIEYKMIEPAKDGDGYDVYGYGTYPRGSVLAGQTRRVFLDGYGTLAEAKAAYPDATEAAGSNHFMFAGQDAGQFPPSDFSEADAGERWDSDY